MSRTTAFRFAFPLLLVVAVVSGQNPANKPADPTDVDGKQPVIPEAASQPPPESTQSEANHFLLAWPPANDAVWAFSKSQGQWAKQEIDPPATKTSAPAIKGDIAVWHVGDKYYAYSAQTANWDTLTVSGDISRSFLMGSDLAVVTSGSKEFYFAVQTGRWSDQKPKAAPPTAPPLDRLPSPNTLGQNVDPATDPPLLSPALPVGVAPSGRYVASGNIIINWTKEFDVVWGFSKSVGKWARQEMNPPASGPPSDAPIISNDIAVWKVGSTLYAFSGAVGRWDVLKLPEDHKSAAGSGRPLVDDNLAVGQVGSRYYGYSGEIGRWDVLNLPEGHSPPPVLDSGFARIHDGDDVYTFAASSGRWSSPQGKEAAIENPPGESRVEIYHLRHARAAAVERILRQLVVGVDSIVADERTNALYVRGSANRLSEVESLLQRLDQPATPAEQKAVGQSSALSHADAAASVAERTKQYEAKEQEAAIIVQQLRAAKELRPGHEAMLRTNLKSVVTQSFQLRQKLHEAELAHLTSRIRGIEQTIQARQKIADQIIDRRVKELLDPNLQWDADRSPGHPPGGSAPREAGVTRSATAADATSAASPPPRITYGKWYPAEAEQIWSALGIKVRQLTPEEWGSSKLRGALIITEIEENRPNQNLRVGDLIVALQSVGGAPGIRKATLEIRRGDETFPVTVEFSSAPPQAASASPGRTPPPGGTPATSTSPPSELTSARAYRDKLRQRWEALEALYSGGKSRLEDILQAAGELGQAESAAAATTDERRTALQEHVERVKRIKAIVEEKYKQQVEPVQNFLAAEAAVIKAEAQLAESDRPRVDVLAPGIKEDSTPAVGLEPPIIPPTAKGGQSLILRTADEFEQRLRDAEKRVADIKEQLNIVGNPATKIRLQPQIDRQLREPERRLAFIREEYAAQLRLLELELLDAESSVQSAGKERDDKKTLVDSGEYPITTLREAQRAYDAARLRLDKAKTLLDLYRKADPKAPAAEPPAKSDPPAQPT